jgi:hypothetical protein
MYNCIRKSSVSLSLDKRRVPRPLRFLLNQLTVKYAVRIAVNFAVDWISIQFALISIIKSV